MAKELTDKEWAILTEVLAELETQSDDPEPQAEYADHDDNWIYFDIYYSDGNGEELKLDRELLSSGETISEIAGQIF